MEADAYHIHQHLDLYVNGRHLTVPALIGINIQQRYLDPLHTHDPSGIIHIESPTTTDYTLGQFFAVWGLRLPATASAASVPAVAKNCAPGSTDTP
jgi:hypothetical protein